MSLPSYFDFLPDERIFDLALFLPLSDITNYCQTSSKFNRIICDNDDFWRMKFIKDHEFNPIYYTGSWKDLYKNYANLWSFGNNEWGQLGLGDTQNRFIPTVIQDFEVKEIKTCLNTTLAIDFQNNVWKIGTNEYENEGDMFLTIAKYRIDSTTPIKIENLKAREISTGQFHSIIIDDQNNVYTFGSNESGQLGLGDDQNRNKATQIPKIKAKQVAAGGSHTVLIDEDNNVLTFGNNKYGQLGLNDNNNRLIPTHILNLKAKQVSAGLGYTIVIDLDNNVWSFGNNAFGQLGVGDNQNRHIPTMLLDIKAQNVSCGIYHSLLIDIENRVWSFGSNHLGKLGLGDTQNRLIPTQINQQFKGKQIAAGYQHTLIIDLENNVWGFGDNHDGQLGLNDNMSRLIPTQIPNFKALKISAGEFHSMMIGTLII